MMIKKSVYRPVPALDPVICKEAYDYLLSYSEEIVDAIEIAVAQGYTPDEIYRYWLRQAGYSRQDLAKRIENAAKYVQSKTT